MQNRIETQDSIAPLSENKFEAGSKSTAMKQTVFGKYLQILNSFEPTYWNNDKEVIDTLIDESHFDETSPIFDEYDLSDEEKHYVHLQSLVKRAKSGDFAPLMLHFSNRNLHALYDQETMDTFENEPNPLEAESLIVKMGEKEFPEILEGSLDTICALWRKLKIPKELPTQFADPLQRDNSVRLNALRTMIYDVTLLKCDEWYLLKPEEKKEVAKLVYSMLLMERELTQDVGIDNPNMSLIEKMQAEEIRAGLKKN